MGLLELTSGSIGSNEEDNSSWLLNTAKDIGIMLAANKAAALGLGALGMGTGAIPVALAGAGLYGITKGLLDNKSLPDTVTEEMIPAVALEAGVQGLTRGIGRPLLKSLITKTPVTSTIEGVTKTTNEYSAGPLIQSLRKTGLESFLKDPNARWDALKPLRDEFLDNPIIPGSFAQNLLKGKTLRDLFVTGQEDIPLLGGITKPENSPIKDFTRRQAFIATTAERSKSIGTNIAELDLDERKALSDLLGSSVELYKGQKISPIKTLLTGEGVAGSNWDEVGLESQKKILNALSPLADISKDVKIVYSNKQQQVMLGTLSKSLSKAITEERVSGSWYKDFPFPQVTYDDSLKAIDKMYVENNAKGAQRELLKLSKKVAEDDSVSLAFKNNIIFLNDIPATTSGAVYSSLMDAAQSTLYTSLKKYKNYVIDDPYMAQAIGYVSIKGPASGAFKDLFVEPSVAKAITELAEVPSEARQMWNKYFFSPWKGWKVLGRPASMMRNLFGNFVMNDIKGAHSLGPITGMNTYREAFEDLRTGGKYTKDFSKLIGLNYTAFDGVNLGELNQSLKTSSNIFDTILSYNNKAMSPFMAFNNFTESWAKVAKFMHNINMGMDKFPAALDATRATFNYSDVTRFTRFARETFAPFATWQTKMLASLPEMFVKRPLTMAKYVAIPYAISSYALNNLGIEKDEWNQFKNNLPEYAKEKMFFLMPWRDDNGKLQMFDLTWWLPGLGDMSEMSSKYFSAQGMMQNPVWTLPAAWYNNKKSNGQPIWYDWHDSNTKIAKWLGYNYQQLMPTWVPGGTDFEKMKDALTEKPEALTVTQAAAAMFGLKVMPFEEGDVQEKKQRLNQMYHKELVGQMKKELAGARTEHETESILRHYEKWLAELYSPGITAGQ